MTNPKGKETNELLNPICGAIIHASGNVRCASNLPCRMHPPKAREEVCNDCMAHYPTGYNHICPPWLKGLTWLKELKRIYDMKNNKPKAREEKKCLCACHENKLKKPYEHSNRCCENMNGYLDSRTSSEREEDAKITSKTTMTKTERCKKEGHAWADNDECGCCGIKIDKGKTEIKWTWEQKLFSRFDFSQVKDRAEHRYLSEDEAHYTIQKFICQELSQDRQEGIKEGESTKNGVKRYLMGFEEGEKEENEAWRRRERCSICGEKMESKPTTDTCDKCWKSE